MKHFLTLAIIAVIAVAFWTSLEFRKRIDADVAESQQDQHYVDLFMRDFTMTGVNEDGSSGFVMQATYLEHYHDEPHSIVTRPKITLRNETNHWVIDAEAGKFDTDGNRISLYKDVVMKQQDTEYPIEMRTEYLEIDADRQIARTDHPVTIDQQEFHLRSDGMLLDSATRKLELLANVEGQYVPLD